MEVVVPDEFKYLYVQSPERPVVKVPNAVLRQKAKPIAKLGKKHQILIDEMIRIMRKANGIGLAAPQIGVLDRIVVIAPGGMRPTPLVNPVIFDAEGEAIGEEGCLSIPGLYGDVLRARSIRVEAYDRKGRPIEFEMEGMPARVVQHEVDHLDGVLFIDKVDIATLHWQHPEGVATEAE
jgi:peptide deformylase